MPDAPTPATSPPAPPRRFQLASRWALKRLAILFLLIATLDYDRMARVIEGVEKVVVDLAENGP